MTITLFIALGGVAGAVGMIGYGLVHAVREIAPAKPSKPRYVGGLWVDDELGDG